MAGIFDTGIFDTGIFDHATGTDTGTNVAAAPSRGGGGAPIWPGALEALFKKKKPKKAEVVQEIVEAVVEAVPDVPEDHSREIAQRMADQMTVLQLRRLQSIDAFVANVKAEMAEMDDEDVLLLAA